MDQKKYCENIGSQLFKNVSIEIGNSTQNCYQKIKYKLCKICKKEVINIKDIARGYPTTINENICKKCVLNTNNMN